MGPQVMPIGFFFMGYELEHAQEALDMCQNYFGLLKGVGHIAKWGGFYWNNLFWVKFF